MTNTLLQEDLNDAVSQLSSCDRGRRVLGHVYRMMAEDACGLDQNNSDALLRLMTVATSHQLNGSVLEALRPYQPPENK